MSVITYLFSQDIVLDTGVTVVPENEPNFVIGTLITTDDDTADNHSYIVVSPWETFAVVGDKLVAKLALDFERKSVYNVSVRSRDDGIPPQSITKVFIINVGDMNEAPSNISLVPSEVNHFIYYFSILQQLHSQMTRLQSVILFQRALLKIGF